MNKIFRLKEHNTTITTEIRAGFTTFCTMAYIIFVNPVFLSSTGMDSNGVMIATCLAAAVGTLLSAFMSNKPFAMASGMGMNAFFAYTLCAGFGYTWQQALALTCISGILFLIVTVSPLQGILIRSIPENLKHAVTAGIGLFIAVIGFLDSGIITMTAGYPALGDLSDPAVLIALAGLALIIILTVKNVRGSLIIGIAFTVILSLIAHQTPVPDKVVSLPSAISTVFMKLDFHGLLLGGASAGAVISLTALVLSLTLVDIFDTAGLLIGTYSRTAAPDDTDYHKGMQRIMIADALATTFGSFFGSSTVTSYAESAAGIAAGGKTGLTALTTAACFTLAIFFAPLTSVVSAASTAPVLIVVGLMIFLEIRKVDFSSMDNSIPAFITISGMTFGYSVTTGIAAGFIAHVLCKLAARKTAKINTTVAVLTVVFVLYFIFLY